MQKENGFTLVEVIAALAFVAIVSIPLFQMFVTSAKVNKEARIMDIANVVANHQAELFKADPSGYDASTKYYDGSGNLKSVPADESDLSGVALKVVSVWTPTDTLENQVGYYPNFSGAVIDLFTMDMDVVVTKVTTVNGDNTTNIVYEIDVAPAGTGSFTPLTCINSSNISSSVLPIEVDYSGGGTTRTINLTNNSDVEAEIFVFNANNPYLSPPAGPPYVYLNTSQGSSSVTFVPNFDRSQNAKSLDKEYTLTLTVSKLNQGSWEEILKYSDDPANPADSAIHKYIYN